MRLGSSGVLTKVKVKVVQSGSAAAILTALHAPVTKAA